MKEYYEGKLLKKVMWYWFGSCDIATTSEEEEWDEKKELERIINAFADPYYGMHGIIGGKR
eukprot:70171-Prorocentrum_lima.AAC.1